MKDLYDLVTAQAYEELGTDKSDEALEAYVNAMSNIDLLRLVSRAIDTEDKALATILREVME